MEGLTPVEGGFSGETFVAQVAGERSVVRVYAGRSLERGPRAPEVDAAVLGMVAPVIPVPRVLEVRAGDPAGDLPGLLVCSHEPGERLDLVLPTLHEEALERVGRGLGEILGRLGLALQPRAGWFTDHRLTLSDGLPSLAEWAEQHRDRLPADLAALIELAARPEDSPPVRLARTCLLGWTSARAGA